MMPRPILERMAVAYATEIERLRAEAAQAEQNWAADWKHEVEKLEAEIEQLRAALMRICTMQGEPIQIARKALANEKEK